MAGQSTAFTATCARLFHAGIYACINSLSVDTRVRNKRLMLYTMNKTYATRPPPSPFPRFDIDSSKRGQVSTIVSPLHVKSCVALALRFYRLDKLFQRILGLWRRSSWTIFLFLIWREIMKNVIRFMFCGWIDNYSVEIKNEEGVE